MGYDSDKDAERTPRAEGPLMQALFDLIKKAEVRGFGFVRDCDGNPKIDSIANLPEELRRQLTPAERALFEGNK